MRFLRNNTRKGIDPKKPRRRILYDLLRRESRIAISNVSQTDLMPQEPLAQGDYEPKVSNAEARGFAYSQALQDMVETSRERLNIGAHVACCALASVDLGFYVSEDPLESLGMHTTDKP